jgi:hypothetical protein
VHHFIVLQFVNDLEMETKLLKCVDEYFEFKYSDHIKNFMNKRTISSAEIDFLREKSCCDLFKQCVKRGCRLGTVKSQLIKSLVNDEEIGGLSPFIVKKLLRFMISNIFDRCIKSKCTFVSSELITETWFITNLVPYAMSKLGLGDCGIDDAEGGIKYNSLQLIELRIILIIDHPLLPISNNIKTTKKDIVEYFATGVQPTKPESVKTPKASTRSPTSHMKTQKVKTQKAKKRRTMTIVKKKHIKLLKFDDTLFIDAATNILFYGADSSFVAAGIVDGGSVRPLNINEVEYCKDNHIPFDIPINLE